MFAAILLLFVNNTTLILFMPAIHFYDKKVYIKQKVCIILIKYYISIYIFYVYRYIFILLNILIKLEIQ